MSDTEHEVFPIERYNGIIGKPPKKSIGVRLEQDSYDLVKDIADSDGKSMSKVVISAIGSYIGMRAKEDEEFADRVRMARERILARELIETYGSIGISPQPENIVGLSETLDLNAERFASLTGIELPADTDAES